MNQIDAPPAAPLSDAEVCEFKELASKATPGPWLLDDTKPHSVLNAEGGFIGSLFINADTNDALFIAAARNIAERLAAEWETMKAQLEADSYLLPEEITEHRKTLEALAAAKERIAELIKEREGPVNLLSFIQVAMAGDDESTDEYEVTDRRWADYAGRIRTERDQLRQQLAEREASIQRLSAILDSYNE